MKKIYEYACHVCKLTWEREYDFGKCADRTRCPKCKKLSGHNWMDRKAPAVHFKGGLQGGWHTKSGGELQGSSDQLNKAMQDGCNARMDKGYQAYAKYTPTHEELQTYVTKKLTTDESKKKIEATKKIAGLIYDKAGLDPYKQAKKKPQ